MLVNHFVRFTHVPYTFTILSAEINLFAIIQSLRLHPRDQAGLLHHSLHPVHLKVK